MDYRDDPTKPEFERSPKLTNRELQVLTLIAEGTSSKQIAANLGISFKTAVTHRMRLMEKLDVHDVAGVVRFTCVQISCLTIFQALRTLDMASLRA